MFQNENMNYQSYRYPVNNQTFQPFNMNGNSYMNRWTQLNPEFYEQEIAFQQELMRQQKEYYEKLIKERYPVKFVAVSSAILAIICLVEITMQIIVMVNKAPLYYVGAGLWAGLFGLVLALLTLTTAFKLTLKLFRASQLLLMLGGIILFFGFCMVTIFALIDYGYTCDSTPCQQKDTSSRPFHIVMISLGAIAVFLVWFMLVFISCKLNTQYAVGNQAMTDYNQSNNNNSFRMNQMNEINQTI